MGTPQVADRTHLGSGGDSLDVQRPVLEIERTAPVRLERAVCSGAPVELLVGERSLPGRVVDPRDARPEKAIYLARPQALKQRVLVVS